ncbi:MAG: hypothetical protein J4F28_08910 [Nitrosopumilaceae archaeon]|nr:hypothetical protein [Nitrosopumilaceae archaeon]
MTGKDIPTGDHICRYCKPSSTVGGKLMAEAFQIRRNEDHLSVNWIEYLGVQDLASAAVMVSELLRGRGYRVKPSGRMAVIGVGTAMSAALDAANKRIRIRHVPRPDDESHAGIFGYTYDDYEIAAALAKQSQSFRTS